MKAKDSARMILKSIQSFSSQTPRYLRQINFIIYQADMVTGFKQAVSSFITEKPGSALGDAWKYVKGTFKGNVKILKIQTPEKFAVITLTIEQAGFTIE